MFSVMPFQMVQVELHATIIKVLSILEQDLYFFPFYLFTKTLCWINSFLYKEMYLDQVTFLRITYCNLL